MWKQKLAFGIELHTFRASKINQCGVFQSFDKWSNKQLQTLIRGVLLNPALQHRRCPGRRRQQQQSRPGWQPPRRRPPPGYQPSYDGKEIVMNKHRQQGFVVYNSTLQIYHNHQQPIHPPHYYIWSLEFTWATTPAAVVSSQKVSNHKGPARTMARMWNKMISRTFIFSWTEVTEDLQRSRVVLMSLKIRGAGVSWGHESWHWGHDHLKLLSLPETLTHNQRQCLHEGFPSSLSPVSDKTAELYEVLLPPWLFIVFSV